MLKDDALFELRECSDRKRQHFTIEQIRAIGEMALNDVWPDGRFTDDECNLWEVFSSIIVRAELKESD